MAYSFDEDVFIIGCWTDSKEKEDVLIKLINKLKNFKVPIILAGHYPVGPDIQKMIDYYIFDKNNDILLEKDFNDYGVNSERWTNTDTYTIRNKMDFHHDYSIWITFKNALSVAERWGKKYVHFLEFDNLPDEVQYRQSFMEYVRRYDAVVYEYSKGSISESNPYCATYIFSINTSTFSQILNKINSKEEFFKNKPDRWQLEKVFYQTLKSTTNNIFVSRYIPNDNELNIFAAWNRDGILRNGGKFQVYFGVDETDELYIHFISGFNNEPADKDYLVEINYDKINKFYNITKGSYQLLKVGKYIQNQELNVYYLGVNVVKLNLNQSVSEFRRKNFITLKKRESINKTININFNDGPFVEILEDNELLYDVEFFNKTTQKVEFTTTLKSNCWARANKKYYIDWLIRIKGIDNDFYKEHEFNVENKRTLISFESKSLGDTLAFIPYVEKFRSDKKTKVICSTFHNDILKDQYPEIEFVNPGSRVDNIYSLFRLGLFYKNGSIDREINYESHKTDPRKEPLMKIASDILGLDYIELKPKLKKLGKTKKKQISIAVHSTAQCKYWNNPNGWQEVVDYLKSKDYEVVLLSREEDGYMGNPNPKGVIQHPIGSLEGLIKTLQESELFIGISSGLSWLSWASGTPTIIISGFTDVDLEPLNGVSRVINKEVCNSCWSKYNFDAGDWMWCPVHKNTDKQFECSKSITSLQVINEINRLLF